MSHLSKCDHGVYWPAVDEIALACQLCNPDGLGAGAEPILPRSSSDTLGRDETRECCKSCGCLRTYFSPNCRNCGQPFPEDDSRGREQGTANRHQPGACPECSSTIHYETKKKSIWECSDCGHKFRAPCKAQSASEVRVKNAERAVASWKNPVIRAKRLAGMKAQRSA